MLKIGILIQVCHIIYNSQRSYSSNGHYQITIISLSRDVASHDRTNPNTWIKSQHATAYVAPKEGRVVKMARKAVIVSYRYRGNPKKRRKCRNAFHHQIFPLTNPNFPFGIPSLLFLQHKFRYSTATAFSPIFFYLFSIFLQN